MGEPAVGLVSQPHELAFVTFFYFLPTSLPSTAPLPACSTWENQLVPYLVGLFGGDKNPAVVTSHALHRWALRHMGEPPVVSHVAFPVLRFGVAF